MDERDDYADPDYVPIWEPSPAAIVVVAFAALVLLGCGTTAAFFWLLVRRAC